MLSPVVISLVTALGGLLVQAVVGWAYLQVLRSEVALLRERADKHEGEISDLKARVMVLESKGA